MRAPAGDHAIWRNAATIETLGAYERLLGETIRPVLAELTLVDAGILFACVCSRHDTALAELVESSSELAIKPGALRYDGHAEVAFDWGEWPTITLALGFVGDGIAAHFLAVFGRCSVGIEVAGLIFTEPLGDHDDNLRRFALALAGSRISAVH